MWGWCWRRAQRPLCPQFRSRRLPIDLLPTGLRGPVFVGPDALVWVLVGLGTNSSMRTRSLRLAAPALLLPKMGPNERRTNVSRTAPASPPLLRSAFFSVLVTSTICRSIDDNPPNSTERRPPGGKTRKKSQTEDRPPDLDHDTPHANQRAGFFFSPPIYLPALPPTCYIAREKRPHPLARTRPGSPFVHPAPPHRLAYLPTCAARPLLGIQPPNQARNEASAPS